MGKLPKDDRRSRQRAGRGSDRVAVGPERPVPRWPAAGHREGKKEPEVIYAIAGREETAQSGRSPRHVNSFTAAGLSTIATFEKHVGHNGFIDLYGNSITISRKWHVQPAGTSSPCCWRWR